MNFILFFNIFIPIYLICINAFSDNILGSKYVIYKKRIMILKILIIHILLT
jgi:hypothetical protein